MPTKYWEGQENSEWWLCSWMLLLEACKKKADWRSWGSSRAGLQNTLGQLNIFFWPARYSTDGVVFGLVGAWESFPCLPPATAGEVSIHTSQLCSCQKKCGVTVSGEAEEREGRWEDKEDGRAEVVTEAALVGYDRRCCLNLLQWGVPGQNPIVRGKLGWVTKFIPLMFHASRHAAPDKVCFVWFCLWSFHREALPGPPFLIGIVIFCCLFIASLPLYLNHPLSLKVLCPACWCIDTQQLYPLWLHVAGCTV